MLKKFSTGIISVCICTGAVSAYMQSDLENLKSPILGRWELFENSEEANSKGCGKGFGYFSISKKSSYIKNFEKGKIEFGKFRGFYAEKPKDHDHIIFFDNNKRITLFWIDNVNKSKIQFRKLAMKEKNTKYIGKK